MKIYSLLFVLFLSLDLTAQTGTGTDKLFKLRAKLVVAERSTTPCGIVGTAIVQKFRVESTDYPGYTNQYIIVIQPCPESLGTTFFRRGHVYEMKIAENSGATFNYSYSNKYAPEHIPVFWCREIKKIE